MHGVTFYQIDYLMFFHYLKSLAHNLALLHFSYMQQLYTKN